MTRNTVHRVSNFARRTGRRVGGFVKKATGAQPRPLQMGISALFGRIFPNLLDQMGVAQMIRSLDKSGQASAFFAQMYQTAPAGWRDDALTDSANKGLATLVAGGAGAKAGYDMLVKGRMSERDLNILLPFTVGETAFGTTVGGNSGYGSYW